MINTIKKVIETCFFTPLFIFGALGSCTIAFLFISTYYNNSAWATVAITILLALITAYYAISTDKILKVNQKTLDLLNIERRLAKVEEIVEFFLIPNISTIERYTDSVKNNTNVHIFHSDTNKIRIDVITIFNNIRVHNALDYFYLQFDDIKINEKYDEPIFHEHIKSIMTNIKKFDELQQKYEPFLKSNVEIFFINSILPSTEKMLPDQNSNLLINSYSEVYTALITNSPDVLKKGLLISKNQNFLDQYLVFINGLHANGRDFQSFVKQKIEYEDQILETLGLLLNDLNGLLSEWMNAYHIPIKKRNTTPVIKNLTVDNLRIR